MPASVLHRPPRSWHKISIRGDSRLTETVAAYLVNLTGTGLEITSPENDRTVTGHTFPTETVTAYIPIGPEKPARKTADQKIKELKHFLENVCLVFPGCPVPNLDIETIMEEDWGEKWKSFFTSFHITPRLTIKPSWEEKREKGLDRDRGRAVIEMDPGLAFGTGHHASTRLALLLLEQFLNDNGVQAKKVLDLGTGSGILAMACGLFGAMEVLAVDNDPDAVETAKRNIYRNRLDGRITVSGQEITAIKGGFDIVVANITHDILADLAKPLTGLINPNGFLVLSGILKGEQELSIRDIYGHQGLALKQRLSKDEWVALLLQKT